MKTKMEQFPANNPNPVLSVSKDGTVLYSNEAGETLLHEWGVRVGEKLPPHIEIFIQRTIAHNIPEKIEVKAGKKVFLVNFHPLPEEECVNLYGFDISDQKKLEEKLQESEKRERARSNELAAVLDAVPVAVYIARDPQALQIKGNRLSYEWLQIPVGTNFSKSAPEGERPEMFSLFKDGVEILPAKMPSQMAAAGREINDCELDIVSSNGKIRHVLGNARPLRDEQGNLRGSISAFIDITERKKAEEALKRVNDNLDKLVKERTTELEEAYNSLKESERILAEAQEMAHIGSWERNFATNKFSWSDEMYRIFGLEPQEFELTFDSFLSYVHPEDREHIDNAIKRAMNGNPFGINFRIILTRGEERIVHAQANAVFDEKSIPVRIRGTTQDITDLRKTEEKLRESEEKYRNIVEIANEGISLTNDEGVITYVNKKMADILGYTIEEIVGRKIWNFVGKEDESTVTMNWKKRRSGFNASYDVKLIHKDGSPTWVYISSKPLFDANGNFMGSLNMHTDITERKQAEETLRESEERFNLAVKAAQEGVWDWNMETNEVWYSPRYKEMLGYSEDEVEHHVSAWLRQLHPDDKERTLQLVDAVMRGERNYELEFRLRHKDGHYLNILSRGYPVRRESDGKIIRIVGIHLDLTERKQAEEILRKSREQYQTLFNSISEGFAHYKAIYDKHGTLHDLLVLEINPAGARISGVDQKEQIGKTWREVWPDAEDYLYKIYNEVDQTGKCIRFEHFSKITGRWYVSQVDRIEKGQLVATFTDITERKTAEFNLRLSEERYRSFIENFKGIAFQIDENFTLEFIHGAVREITGYSAEELFSHILWRQLVVPEDLDMFLESEEKAAQSPGDFQGEIEYRIRTKDGNIKWLHEFHQKVSGKSGKPEKYIGIVSDITEKKEAEYALAKFEITRQKEIHHRIKNNLQVISSLLDLQAEKFINRKCVENKEVLEAFTESQNRVMSIAFIHKELHEGGGLDTLNFSLYLKKLTENLYQTYHVGNSNISLNLDLEEDVFYDMDIAIPLGMIVNELVSNSFKYAFLGRKTGEIQIKSFSEKAINDLKNKEEFNEKSTIYTLIVSDNGIGIPREINLENSDTLGLQLVNILIDQLDGELELKRESGTEFIIKFIVSSTK